MIDLKTEYSRLVEVSYPGVKVACDVTFDEIWTLFLASGFLYPEKVARLQPVMAEVQQTVRNLLSENGNLFGTVVLRHDKVLDAHMSILRWCDKTWIVQHLAALPMSSRGLDSSARLTLGFTYYGRLRPDLEWVKMYFRPNNPFPARVFGGYARQVKDPTTSDLRVYHYLVATIDSPTSAPPASIDVVPAEAGDFAFIENWFASRGRHVELAANHYDAERANLKGIREKFEGAGLMRGRESLIARRKDGQITGFALLEMASLGMNFSELTNAFTVHLADDSDEESRLALIIAAKLRYRTLLRRQVVALEEGDNLASFEAAGFAKTKDYACWTFHREHLTGMEEHFINLFGARRSSVAPGPVQK